MNIMVVQLYTHHIKNIGAISETNIKKYCEDKGYQYKCFYDSLDSKRHPAWSKIKAVQWALDQDDIDWVWWIDADAFVANNTITLEEIINTYARNDIDIIFADQKYRKKPNTGSFLVRNTEYSKSFLNTIYNDTTDEIKFNRSCCWEQDAITTLLTGHRHDNAEENIIANTTIFDKIIMIKNNIFNSVKHENCDKLNTYNNGDFIIHFAGGNTTSYIIKTLKNLKII